MRRLLLLAMLGPVVFLTAACPPKSSRVRTQPPPTTEVVVWDTDAAQVDCAYLLAEAGAVEPFTFGAPVLTDPETRWYWDLPATDGSGQAFTCELLVDESQGVASVEGWR